MIEKINAFKIADEHGLGEQYTRHLLDAILVKQCEIIDHLQGRGDINTQPAQGPCSDCIVEVYCNKHRTKERDCGEYVMLPKTTNLVGLHKLYFAGELYVKTSNSDEGNGS